jgi:hypothetical protein
MLLILFFINFTDVKKVIEEMEPRVEIDTSAEKGRIDR